MSRRSSLISALLLVSALSSPGRGAIAAPDQAVLLDGSKDASAVFHIAFTNQGLQISVVKPPAQCPGASHVPQAGLFPASPPAVGVYQFDGSGGGSFVVAPPLVALPLNLDDFQDDCDILARFSEVVAYVDDVSLEATDLIDRIDNCVEDARSAYCQLVALITSPDIEENLVNRLEPCQVLDPAGAISGISDSPCDEFLVMLVSTPTMLKAMYRNLLSCQMQVTFMESWAAQIVARGYVSGARETALALADKVMSQASGQSAQAHYLRSEINDVKARFLLREVTLSCEQCDDSPPADPLIPLSGAVLLQTERSPLDRYVSAFHTAATDTADPTLARRLSTIALRLEEIPDGRVHHLTFKSTSGIGQEYLALAPADAPDDARSPLVVVLTALDEQARLPPMNSADRSLLFDGLRSFIEGLNITRIRFRRGDCNDDGDVDISDAICILGWLFLGDPLPGCVAATNTNGDTDADLSDAVYLLGHLFLGGPAPVEPFPECAPGTADDYEELGCETPPVNCQSE